MATHGIKQLKKLRLFYSEHSGSSRGVREFISSGEVVLFAKSEPNVDVIIQPKLPGQHPYVKGQYCSGFSKQICVKNYTPKEIKKAIEMLNNSSGRKMTKFEKPVISRTPSVQGIWTPHLDVVNETFDIKIIKN